MLNVLAKMPGRFMVTVLEPTWISFNVLLL